MKKFKVGDKVRMINPFCGEGGNGEICYAVKVTENGKIEYIQTDGSFGWKKESRGFNLPDYNGHNTYWSVLGGNDCFELIEESEPKITDTHILDGNVIVSFDNQEDYNKFGEILVKEKKLNNLNVKNRNIEWIRSIFSNSFYKLNDKMNDKMAVHLRGGSWYGWCNLKFYETDIDYKDYKFINAKEVLYPQHKVSSREFVYEKLLSNLLEHYKNNQDLEMGTNNMELRQIPNTIKRVLNKDLRAQYRAGYINGDLKLTHEGVDALLDLLSQKFAKELAASAQEVIDEVEAQNK